MIFTQSAFGNSAAIYKHFAPPGLEYPNMPSTPIEVAL